MSIEYVQWVVAAWDLFMILDSLKVETFKGASSIHSLILLLIMLFLKMQNRILQLSHRYRQSHRVHPTTWNYCYTDMVSRFTRRSSFHTLPPMQPEIYMRCLQSKSINLSLRLFQALFSAKKEKSLWSFAFSHIKVGGILFQLFFSLSIRHYIPLAGST